MEPGEPVQMNIYQSNTYRKDFRWLHFNNEPRVQERQQVKDQQFCISVFVTYTARKTIFSFSKCSEKMIFPKKLHWNMIFLVSSGKMIFLFPENMILFFRRKMKDDLSQKKYMEIWYILQMFRKDGLSKKIALEYDLSYIMRKDGISFSRKYDIFLWTENERWYFSKNIWKYDVFCMLVKVVFLFPTNMKLPFCQKSKDDLFFEKCT